MLGGMISDAMQSYWALPKDVHDDPIRSVRKSSS